MRLATIVACGLIVSLVFVASLRADEDHKSDDHQISNDAFKKLINGTTEEKQTIAERVVVNSEQYSPEVFYALAMYFFKQGKKEEAFFWYHAGRLRLLFEVRCSTDPSAGAIIGAMDFCYGQVVDPPIDLEKGKLRSIAEKVVDWDRKTARKYSATSRAVPKDQWEKIAEENRKEYLLAMGRLTTPTSLGTPREFFRDPDAVAIAEAAERGNVKEIDRLVSAGAPINATGKYGVTPLLWAMWARNKAGFIRLLERGASPDVIVIIPREDVSEGGELTYALKSWSAIAQAAGELDDSEWLEVLLKHGANPNLPPPDAEKAIVRYAGRTAIFTAVDIGNQKNIDLLLRAGADPNHQDAFGKTPAIALMYSDQIKNRFTTLHHLLEVGIDYRIKDRLGEDVVYLALRYEPDLKSDEAIWRDKVIELLKKKGEDLEAVRKRIADERAKREQASKACQDFAESMEKEEAELDVTRKQMTEERSHFEKEQKSRQDQAGGD